MRKPAATKRKKSKQNSQVLRIFAQDNQLFSLMEFQDVHDPQGPWLLQFTLKNARLADNSNTMIAIGMMQVRMKSDLPLPSLLILGQLMSPFKGALNLVLTGTFLPPQQGSPYKVFADEVLNVEIEPVFSK